MSEQIARAVEDMRGRSREITQTTAQQAKAASTTAGEMREVASRLGHLSRIQGAQAEGLARLGGLLGVRKQEARPEGRPVKAVEPS
jgi:methyl-accepting chemotaxis protein